MSNKYYCKGNLKHNGRTYRRGDEVELDERSATVLLKDKVVQSTPLPPEDLEDQAEVVPAEEDGAPAQPEAGGNVPEETGEPTIDGEDQATENRGGILGRVFNKKEDAEGSKDVDPSAGL